MKLVRYSPFTRLKNKLNSDIFYTVVIAVYLMEDLSLAAQVGFSGLITLTLIVPV